jgi:hypothetical protein
MRATQRIQGLEIPSTANLREHHHAKARRAAALRQSALEISWQTIERAKQSLPIVVHLVRVAPRPLDDDNLSHAFKAFRDGIAERLGIDDRDPRVRYTYGQERGRPREVAVVVTVTDQG